MRFLLFLFIEPWLFPFQAAAYLAIVRKIKQSRGSGISATAGKPHDTRYILHQMGKRPDEGADRIGPHIPMRSPFIHWAIGTIGLALRWSGLRTGFTEYPPPLPVGLKQFVYRRTWFFDHHLDEAIDADIAQVVILGAGWDTRGWGLLSDRGVRVFEIDTQLTQDAKKRAVEAGGLPMDAVTFVTTDFIEKTWLEAITEQGYDASLPTFFLLEGLVYYLDDASVEATLRDIAAAAPGSALAFDYLSAEVIHPEAPHLELGEQVLGSMERYYPDEPLMSGISTKPPARDKAAAWLGALDLELDTWEPLGPEDQAFGGLVLARTRTPEA